MKESPLVNFGAVDIGSNAVRLLIAKVHSLDGEHSVKKLAFLRVPIRLGEEVFDKGKISDHKKHQLAHALSAFQGLLGIYGVDKFRICATSAMRDARNRKEVMAFVEGRSGLKIEVIDGGIEAELIFGTFFSQQFDRSKNYLYIDVGGGSTELTLIKKGKPIRSKSFDVGTIRLLKGSVKDEVWAELNRWIKKIDDSIHPLTAIGTGGNINKIIKMMGLQSTKVIEYKGLKEFKSFLESFTVEQRVSKLGLRTDRADVIAPAAYLYTSIMKKADISEIHVPKSGLCDGIVLDLWRRAGVLKD